MILLVHNELLCGYCINQQRCISIFLDNRMNNTMAHFVELLKLLFLLHEF